MLDAAMTGVSTRARRIADVTLAALVVLMVGMMIVPLPTWLLDILITSNISIAVLMLLVALYVRSGLSFTAFPTILLITTLYRLALNVSSTRLILVQADAGDVIYAFGTFVVRGNYVVGAVVFLILTLIQFIVIAKGSERVAEVGARFALDAMPGKQMSIDAELRSGAIGQEEARTRRRTLQRESELYGAMDGAMKFVKGDAIAGIVITIVNIAGGLVVGVAQRDMSALEALQVYGLLTIGDGLVSQIPALLISTAAGLVVTRVSSEDEHASLGSDVATQIFGDPKALTVAAAFLLALAIVPGLPALPFLVLSAVFFVTSRRIRKSTGGAEVGEAPRVPMVVPLSIEVGRELGGRTLERLIEVALPRAKDALFDDLGIALPGVRATVSTELDDRAYRVAVGEVPVRRGVLPASDDDAAALALQVDHAARRHARELVGLSEAQAMLDQLESTYPALVRHVVPSPVSLPLLTEVLRRLVSEGVSIRPLREILEALALHAPSEREAAALTELVRAALRRQITHRHASGETLAVHVIEPDVEEAVREAIRPGATGAYLALPPDLARELVGAVRKASAARRVVLLTQPDVRRFVRQLVEVELPEVPVLSYPELPPEVAVQTVGRIGL